jgi:hypothetical protein
VLLFKLDLLQIYNDTIWNVLLSFGFLYGKSKPSVTSLTGKFQTRPVKLKMCSTFYGRKEKKKPKLHRMPHAESVFRLNK